MNSHIIKSSDPELYKLLCDEAERQCGTLDLTASESIQDEVSRALSGSVFCNKTAVGLPGKQRLGGSDTADRLERLAAARACELFGAEYANILPYSGTTANLCVYDGLLSPGDKILALDPEHGSHASHGRHEHISAKLYDFVHFGLDRATLLINYDEVERLLEMHRPKLLVVGVSAYSRLIDFKRLADSAHSCGAVFMVDMAHTSGLCAAGVISSPVPYADIVTASATKTMCGCHTGYILCKKQFADAVDRGVYPGVLASMHLQTVAAAAWAFKRARSDEFRAVMEQTVRNARALCDELKKQGFGILTGGTDCHMFVIDLRPLYAEYPSLEAISYSERLESIGISLNTKRIPYDESEKVGGLRAGCTILAQRGMKEGEMAEVADIFRLALDEANLDKCAEKVKLLCEKFPI